MDIPPIIDDQDSLIFPCSSFLSNPHPWTLPLTPPQTKALATVNLPSLLLDDDDDDDDSLLSPLSPEWFESHSHSDSGSSSPAFSFNSDITDDSQSGLSDPQSSPPTDHAFRLPSPESNCVPYPTISDQGLGLLLTPPPSPPQCVPQNPIPSSPPPPPQFISRLTSLGREARALLAFKLPGFQPLDQEHHGFSSIDNLVARMTLRRTEGQGRVIVEGKATRGIRRGKSSLSQSWVPEDNEPVDEIELESELEKLDLDLGELW